MRNFFSFSLRLIIGYLKLCLHNFSSKDEFCDMKGLSSLLLQWYASNNQENIKISNPLGIFG